MVSKVRSHAEKPVQTDGASDDAHAGGDDGDDLLCQSLLLSEIVTGKNGRAQTPLVQRWMHVQCHLDRCCESATDGTAEGRHWSGA